MAELNQEKVMDERNLAAKRDEKEVKPQVPETKVPDKAGNHGKTPAKAPVPFYQAVCDLADWGLDTKGDFNVNLNLGDYSLDPVLKRFKQAKKKLEEEIKGWIICKFPDSIRPISLTIHIIEKIQQVIKLVQCSMKIVQQIMRLIEKITTAIVKAMNQIRQYIARQLAILKQLQAMITGFPNWFLMTLMKEINKKLLDYLKGPADLIKNVMTLIREVKRMQKMIRNMPNFLNNQINRIRSSMKQVCDSIKRAKNTLAAMDWHIKKPDLLGAFLQVASVQEKWLLQKLLKLGNPRVKGFNVYSSNRYTGYNTGGFMAVAFGGGTGTDSTTVAMTPNKLAEASKSLVAASLACASFVVLPAPKLEDVITLRRELGEAVYQIGKIEEAKYESPINMNETRMTKLPMDRLIARIENVVSQDQVSYTLPTNEVEAVGDKAKTLADRIDTFIVYEPLPTSDEFNNLVAGGETGTDSMNEPVSGDRLEEMKKIAELLAAEIDSNSDDEDFVREKASEIDAQSDKLLAQLERIDEITTGVAEAKANLQQLEVKRQEMHQSYLDMKKELNTTVDTRLLGYNSSAFYFTMTNNQTEFQDLDGVTNYSLYRQIASMPENTWTDIFTANEPGVMILGNERYGAFELATHAKMQSLSDLTLGLRLMIDNGSWILEAYSDGSLSRADIEDGSHAITFGKFTAVPVAPKPGMTRVATSDEFRRAYNNPMAIDKTEEIILAVPIGTDLTSVITSADDTDYLNGLNGQPWMRYYSQQEIDELEAFYVEALQSLNLSVMYPTDNMLHLKEEKIWSRPDFSFITRKFAFPTDTQITDMLLDRKPYHGMKIPARGITFQFSKISQNVDRINDLDKDQVPFGISAQWGFMSSVK